MMRRQSIPSTSLGIINASGVKIELARVRGRIVGKPDVGKLGDQISK